MSDLEGLTGSHLIFLRFSFNRSVYEKKVIEDDISVL